MFLMVQIIQTSLGCWFNIKVSTSSVKNGVRENDGMVAVHRKKKKKKTGIQTQTFRENQKLLQVFITAFLSFFY